LIVSQDKEKVMSKYSPEALEPENLAGCIDAHGKKIDNLESLVINDDHVGVFGLSSRIDNLEKQLEAVTELHLRALEENTEQIGILIKMSRKPGKLSEWLARFGL
jgi:hypothetical protein